MERITALGKFLELELEEGETYEDYVTEGSYTENSFDGEGGTYLVLTDSEADDATLEYVKSSLWVFNASFLAEQTDLPEEVFQALSERYEDANETLKTLVEKHCDGGIEGFTREATRYDGRGHFLAQYDGAENEYEGFYIYRTN